MNCNGEAYILEFIKIVGFIVKSGKAIYIGREFRRYILLPREVLEQFMNKNQFDTVDNKLRYWKRLNWIKADEKRFTRKVTVNGKQVRGITVDMEVFRALVELFDELL